jgi:hypothetical protein
MIRLSATVKPMTSMVLAVMMLFRVEVAMILYQVQMAQQEELAS